MSAVFTIAWRDFKSYFASPKGAIIAFLFLITMGLFFRNFVNTFVELTQRAPMYGGESPTLEQLLRALFYNVHFVFILVIPLMTMSAFSEERRNQTLRLLQTSPVTATQIVLGKFMATAGMIILILAASAVYPAYLALYGNPDVGLIFVSYLGLFLFMCGQLAFGLWISSMTSNQIIAALFTIFGMFGLLILNWLAPSIAGGGWVQTVLKYIASTDHLDVFFKGMLTVSDVTYFICMIALFLFFTNVVVDSARWR